MTEPTALSSSFVPDAIQPLATQESAPCLSASATPSPECHVQDGATTSKQIAGQDDASSNARPTTHALLSNDPVKREAKWQALLRVQREIEEESMARGADRFKRRIIQAETAGKASTMGAAKRLLTHGITPTEAAITFFLQEQKARRGAKHSAVKWIEMIGTDVAAYMTIRSVLDLLGSRPAVSGVASALVELMLDELRYRRFEEQAPGLFKYKLNSFNTSSYVHMARSMNAAMRHASVDVTDLNLTPSQRIIIGTKLIDLMVQATSLVTIEHTATSERKRQRVRYKQEAVIVPTAETREFMSKRNTILEMLSPLLMPMVVPPMQWEPGRKGGYRFALRNKVALVRSAQYRESQCDRMNRDREMPLVFSALNAIQNTPWVINRPVLALLQNLSATRVTVAGLPTDDREAMPPKPHDIDTNADARKAWRHAAHAVKEKNHERDARALEFGRIVSAAQRMSEFDAIFFPHNLDFRGRIYPVPHFLTPQGDDVQKGLLKFAQGKPLGDHGASYLALHGANCLGKTLEGQKVSRMTLDERIQWIEDHSAEICAAANDPLGYRWWSEAEDPIQFYAFCVEWNGFVLLQREGRGNEYVCSLPVSIDGSCNGLQHFSAMLKDTVGAKAVNVFPNERPEDVYDRIAAAVKDRLEIDGSTNALRWLASGLVDRKLTKRPTMTFSYGSKPYGFQQQLVEYLWGLENWRDLKPLFQTETEEGKTKDAIQPMCALMAQMIWLSLQDVVVAAFRGMEWMQKCARIVSKNKKPIEWTVPRTGFRVRQEYFVTQQKQIKTVLAGRVFQPVVNEATEEIQLHKQANAVSPNVIHSLDAAGLMLAISDAFNSGVEQFAAVHDSYGTLPTDMPVLWQAARHSFVHLYGNESIIDNLAGQFQAQAPDNERIPYRPNSGDLDVNRVLLSDYFFC